MSSPTCQRRIYRLLTTALRVHPDPDSTVCAVRSYLVNDVCGCHEIRRTVLVLNIFWACAGNPERGTREAKFSDLVFVPEERDALQKVGRKVSQVSSSHRLSLTLDSPVSPTFGNYRASNVKQSSSDITGLPLLPESGRDEGRRLAALAHHVRRCGLEVSD